MKAASFPPRISSTLLEKIGYFLPRLLFTNTRIAPQLHWGDITRALDGMIPTLIDPNSAEFWNEWRKRFTTLAMGYESLSESSISKAGRSSALRSAAAAYHFAEFMFFENVQIKTTLRQAVRHCFIKALKDIDIIYKSSFIKAGKGYVQIFFFPPYKYIQTVKKRFPCVILCNGLDSITEIEILSIGEYLLERGIGVLLFEGPGQGLNLGIDPLYIEIESIIIDLVKYLSKESEIDIDKLGFLGVSFGGYFALRVAEKLPDIFRGIVNFSGGPELFPYESLPRRLKQDFAFAFNLQDPEDVQLLFDKLRLRRPTKNIGPRILSMHGCLDDIFPVNALESYAQNCGDRHTIHLLKTEAHVCMNYLHPNLIKASDWLLEILESV